jgi:hypothetical protein
MKNYLLNHHSTKKIECITILWWVLVLLFVHLTSRLTSIFSCTLYHAFTQKGWSLFTNMFSILALQHKMINIENEQRQGTSIIELSKVIIPHRISLNPQWYWISCLATQLRVIYNIVIQCSHCFIAHMVPTMLHKARCSNIEMLRRTTKYSSFRNQKYQLITG